MTSPTAEQRVAFVRDLLRLAGAGPLGASAASSAPLTDDLEPFRRHVVPHWASIRLRLLGAVVDAAKRLGPRQQALLRVLEDAPDLLGPLDQARDEVSHTRLITWFLQQEDEVGDRCRQALLGHLGLPHGDGWAVRREVVVAKGCRVDLVIEGPGWLVYLEAKLDAPEGFEQLASYAEALQRESARRGLQPRLALLTVHRDDATFSRAPDVHLTYDDLLRLWLPATVLPGPTAAYLGAYLATVVRQVCEVAETGSFFDWSLAAQHRTLKLLAKVEVGDER